MRQTTRADHEIRLEEVVRYIAEHLDEPINLGDLADLACLSWFHFHRVFQALLGETVGEMSRRLRLERACESLRTTDEPITELAFEAGYSTHEAFIRAFRTAFGCTPSTMRKRLRYAGQLPALNGVHFGKTTEVRFVSTQGDPTMNVEIRDFPPQKAVCMSHSGPYYMIGQTFGKLMVWRQGSGIKCGRAVALFYDDIESTPVDKLRSDAGLFVSDEFTTDDPQVQVKEVGGGAYMVTTFVGPYDGLASAWDTFSKQGLPEGYTYCSGPAFEVYTRMTETPGGAESETELHMAVRKQEN